MSEKPGPSADEKRISRRHFLKLAGAAAVAGPSILAEGCSPQERSDPEKLAEVLKAPRQTMEVGGWGKEESANLPIAISQLRENAGWPLDYKEEFEQALSQLNPNMVGEDHTIQPGVYEVPMNKNESEVGE